MKSKKIVMALTLTLLLGASGSALAYGATSNNTTPGTAVHQGLGMNRITGVRGYDYVTSVLKNKLGLTDKEITDGLTSGKTVYDLAKAKGMTEEQFQAALLEEKSKALDAAVTKGTITKEQGDTLKATLKANQSTCTGNFGSGNMNKNRTGNSHGNGGRMGGGMMGSGSEVFK